MELETKVTAVAVYPDRGRVTRTGTVTLDPGSYRLEVPELPLVLDPASVRAAAKGTAQARLLGIDVRRVYYKETPAEQVRELEAEIEALQDKLNALNARTARLQEKRAVLQALSEETATYARGLAFAKTTAEDQLALVDAVYERAGELDTALLAAQIERRDLERQVHKLQHDLKRLRGAKGKERYTATVELDVSKGGALEVALTYVISKAAWTALYDLRLLEGHTPASEQALTVTYLAQVSQSTGEPWENVVLTLSTARPALAETLPELEPWYIEPLYRAPAGAVKRRAAMPAAAPPSPLMDTLGAGMEAEEAEAAPVAAEMVTATVESTGAAVTYKVPEAVSVPADGEPHKVTVGQVGLAPELDYIAVPKLVDAAYRRAKVANDSPYTLLPGKASLFAGDAFIGTTELELTAPAGEIELYLGVDDRVKVARELKRREVDKKLLGDKRRLHYAYEIEVENLLAVATKLTLHDQIPVSRHEAIKVKLDQVDPKPAELSDLGLLRWELALEAGEKRTVTFAYTVEHPRDMQVRDLG